MRHDLMAALILAASLPPDTIIYEERKPRPKFPDVPDDFILKPVPEVTGTRRPAYLGKVVRVRVNPDEANAIVNDMRERRRLNHLHAKLKGAI